MSRQQPESILATLPTPKPPARPKKATPKKPISAPLPKKSTPKNPICA